MSSQRIYKIGSVNPFVFLIVVAVIIMAVFWVAKSIFRLLNLIAPFLLIGALILNYRVVLGYGKWLAQSVQRNPVFGILAIIFTLIGFPLVAGFLFMRALSTRGGNNTAGKLGEYIRYEEVDDDFLDLSDIKEQKKKLDDDYNDVVN